MGNVKIQQIVPPPGSGSVRPQQFPHGPREFTPNLDYGRLYLIWLFQGAVFLSVNGICWRFGVSPWMWVTGMVVLLALWAGLGYLMWQNASTPDPLSPRSCLLWHMKAGIWLTCGGILAFCVAIAIRINWKESFWSGLIFCGFLVIVAGATFVVSRYAIRHQATPWFQFAIGVTIIPLLVAWSVASLISWLDPRVAGAAARTALEKARLAELPRRAQWSKHTGWVGSGDQPVVVAVALSGGGYRAASIHAGLLRALDERCAPIRYLSTVSGGSIIGAYYALGYPPGMFKSKLMDHKPGLPDDILSIGAVFVDWFWPKWSSADTYSRHLGYIFFDSKVLADTGETPRLLINATDIEQDADRASEVFYKGRRQSNPELDQTLLTDIVSASGAYPGAFQPKIIRWVPAEGIGIPLHRRFVDGGVVDNLGISGLLRFLALNSLNSQDASLRPPNVLIISDASKRGRAGHLPVKVELLQLLSRSQGISYDTLHKLYKRLIDERPGIEPLWIHATDEAAAEILKTYTFQGAVGPQKNQVISGDAVAREVAQYDTLKELKSEEVEKAVWVGYTLGRHYWSRLDAIRQKLGGRGSECATSS